MNAGATVCHVDASKGMVQWAKENAASSGIADRPVRWLVDDCVKFVEREIRRGNKYDGIIMDLHHTVVGLKVKHGKSKKVFSHLWSFAPTF